MSTAIARRAPQRSGLLNAPLPNWSRTFVFVTPDEEFGLNGHADILAKREQHRQLLFRIFNDLRRQARDSEDFELHRFVGEAYQTYLRSFLDADERRLIDAEEQIASLQAELNEWRRGIRRRDPC